METIDNSDIIKIEGNKIKRDYQTELSQKFGKNHYDGMHDLIDSCENQSLVKVWDKYESQIKVGDAAYTGHAHCSGYEIFVNGVEDAKGSTWYAPYQTTFHESGHAIDTLARSKIPDGHWGARHFSSAYKDGLFPQTIKNEVQEMVSALDKKMKMEFKLHADDFDWLIQNDYISGWEADWYKKYGSWFSGKPKYSKSMAYKALQRQIDADLPKGIARADLSDILDGATNHKISLGFGHPGDYWSKRTYDGIADGLATEAFAEMIDSSFTAPESLDAIKKYLPKSYEVFLEMLDEILK